MVAPQTPPQLSLEPADGEENYERFVPFFLRAGVVPKIIDRLPVSKDNISFDFKARRFISGRGVPVASRHHRWLGAFVPQEKRSLFVPELVRTTSTPMKSPTSTRDDGFFEPSYVQRLLREHTEGVRDHRKLLWTLLVFELWQEKYLRR